MPSEMSSLATVSGSMEGELCGLRAGLSHIEDKGFMEDVKKLYPPKCWDGMHEVGKGKPKNDYHNLHADPAWYGCQRPATFKDWKKTDSLPSVAEDVKAKVKAQIKLYKDQHNHTKLALTSLNQTWEAFEANRVLSTDLEVVNKDIDCMMYFHPETKNTVITDLSTQHFNWDEQPWDALEAAAAVDVAAGADVEKVVSLLGQAYRLVSMVSAAGKYKAQAVRASDNLVGERIVLCSLLIGQDQIKLGFDVYWMHHCSNLRLMTYRAQCGAYSRGVIAESECTLRQVFNAGGTTPPMTGNVMWSRVRAAYVAQMPRELGDIVEKRMKEARSRFVYPSHSVRDIGEMNAWCDVTTFDWYALCGPTAENVSTAAVGALMLGYECEVLVDMCPKVTYSDYMAFIAAGVDCIPHMDAKEMVAGAFAAHACGVKGFPGLHWLHNAIDTYTQQGGSMWGPRNVDGAAYLMFLGINEGCRMPAIRYSDVRMRAEINLMAAHEVGGLFRHGMEGDAMSRSMLDGDATIASFPMMIDKLAEDGVNVGRDMGAPHSTGFMLTCFGYLLFNLVGSSSMMRWASGAKPRCDSIAVVADKTENAKLPHPTPEETAVATAVSELSMTRDMMKVSTLAAHRALRLGIDTDYMERHKHVPGGDCVCWNCLAGQDKPCAICGTK